MYSSPGRRVALAVEGWADGAAVPGLRRTERGAEAAVAARANLSAVEEPRLPGRRGLCLR